MNLSLEKKLGQSSLKLLLFTVYRLLFKFILLLLKHDCYNKKVKIQNSCKINSMKVKYVQT